MSEFLPDRVSWENWGELFLDLNLWRPVVARICAATAVAHASHIEAGFPGGCAVFVVDRQVVVKLYPPMMEQDFYREREVYGLLDGRLPHLPRLLGDGVYHDQIDWPYLLLEFREGEAIREVFDEITAANRLVIASELGAMLRILHETAVDHTTTFDPTPTAWATFLAGRRAACLDEFRRETYLPEAVLAELERFIQEIDLGVKRPILINADLTEDHLLLIKRDNQWHISALIDWADAEVGAPEYEWIALWFGLCQRDGAMFREIMRVYDPGWRLDDAFLGRVMAYTVLHRFGAGIVEHVLAQDGRPPIHSLADLREQLWGNLGGKVT
jgi:hygromycin-B 7''-O-kinase